MSTNAALTSDAVRDTSDASGGKTLLTCSRYKPAYISTQGSQNQTILFSTILTLI